MTQAKTKFTSFEDYLTCEDGTENRSELINGALIELPPESRLNITIANYLFLALVQSGVPFQLIHPHACELQVPVIKPGNPMNRYPDLVVLREAHLELTERRLTVTLEMPPPRFVAEVVSAGQRNRDRDYQEKFAQYQARDIDEYWIIDPHEQAITVFVLSQEKYEALGCFREDDLILSTVFPALNLVASTALTAQL